MKNETLIIRPAALGDTLMLLPALVSIRGAGKAVVVGRAPGIHYLRRFVRRCVDFEGGGWHGLFMEDPALKDLPGADLIVAFLKDGEGIVRKNLHSLFRGSRIFVYPGLPESTAGVHTALYLARCLRMAGVDLDPEGCFNNALNRPILQDGFPRQEMETVIFHPGSGGQVKNHSPQFWIALLEAFYRHPLSHGLRPLLLLGPAEEHLHPFFAAHLEKHGQGSILVSPGPDDLMSLLEQCALYLGHDSGVTHLAAMSGARTIVIFKRSSAPMWRPLGPYVTALQDIPEEELLSAVLKEGLRLMRRP